MHNRPYRVVQWATGALGRGMLRAVAARPDLELAGVYVHDPAKVGRDAGLLCGLPDTGVTATGDVDEIVAMSADCVLYAPLPSCVLDGRPHGDLDTICALLASGKNLITATGLLYPYAHGPALVGELEKACATGGTSVHGTGINPGFLCDVLPLVLSGLSRQVTHVYAFECSDLAGYPSRRFVRDLAGLGRDEAAYVAALPAARSAMRSLFAESLHLVAAGLGTELDRLDLDVEYLLAEEDFEIAAGPIPRGSVAGHRWTFNGMIGDRPLVTLECVYLADARRTTRWPAPGYAVRVDGHPAISLRAESDWITNGLTAASARAVNTVPALCTAPPGIRTALDLPMIIGPSLA
jgi:hypothetical protein